MILPFSSPRDPPPCYAFPFLGLRIWRRGNSLFDDEFCIFFLSPCCCRCRNMNANNAALNQLSAGPCTVWILAGGRLPAGVDAAVVAAPVNGKMQ